MKQAKPQIAFGIAPLTSVAVATALFGLHGAAANAHASRPALPIKEKSVSRLACANDPLSRSICMIRYITDDIAKEFKGIDGGGISEIKATSSTSYIISLPREQRIQRFTYEFKVESGSITFSGRTETTKSF